MIRLCSTRAKAASRTAFLYDERCFWHGGSGLYALLSPVSLPNGVQPLAGGAGLPEAPETKRRLKNLIDVTGLARDLDVMTTAALALDHVDDDGSEIDGLEMPRESLLTRADLERIHPPSYLDEFKALSDGGGGELGLRTPFGPGGFEVSCLSAGLVKSALFSVLDGRHTNAYALSRPPGHHCLPDWPNGFCLLNNIGIAIEAALATGRAKKVAVVDFDVHHGNGTETIFWERDDCLSISIHQESNYPANSGALDDRGAGAGLNKNANIPLPPGAGHATYIEATERVVVPLLREYKPDVIIVACGFDASGVDPLSRMLATADTFRDMTAHLMAAADELCDGKLVFAHEGGYSELHVPFCGHAVLKQLSGSDVEVDDPLEERLKYQQPNERALAFYSSEIDVMVDTFNC